MDMYCVLILITGMIPKTKKRKDPLQRLFSCNINMKSDAHILNIFFLHMIVLYMMIFEPYHCILRFKSLIHVL